MTFSVTWDETSPADGDNIYDGDDAIRNFKTSVRERMAEEHRAYADESGYSFVWGHKPMLRRTAITQADTPYTLLDSDYYVNVQASTALNIAMPACSGQTAGRCIIFHGEDVSGGVTLTPNGSDTIRNANVVFPLLADGHMVCLLTDASEWFILWERIPIILDSSMSATGGSTDEVTLGTVTLPANALKTGDCVRIISTMSITGANDAKTIKQYFGSAILTDAQGGATAGAGRVHGFVHVTGAATQEAESNYLLLGSDLADLELTSLTEDTTAAIEIKVTGQTNNASDEVTGTMHCVEILRGYP